jgi:hypothetical protein
VPLHGQTEFGRGPAPVDFLQGVTVRVGAHEFRYDAVTARAGFDAVGLPVDCPALSTARIYSDAPDEHCATSP